MQNQFEPQPILRESTSGDVLVQKLYTLEQNSTEGDLGEYGRAQIYGELLTYLAETGDLALCQPVFESTEAGAEPQMRDQAVHQHNTKIWKQYLIIKDMILNNQITSDQENTPATETDNIAA